MLQRNNLAQKPQWGEGLDTLRRATRCGTLPGSGHFGLPKVEIPSQTQDVLAGNPGLLAIHCWTFQGQLQEGKFPFLKNQQKIYKIAKILKKGFTLVTNKSQRLQWNLLEKVQPLRGDNRWTRVAFVEFHVSPKFWRKTSIWKRTVCDMP